MREPSQGEWLLLRAANRLEDRAVDRAVQAWGEGEDLWDAAEWIDEFLIKEWGADYL